MWLGPISGLKYKGYDIVSMCLVISLVYSGWWKSLKLSVRMDKNVVCCAVQAAQERKYVIWNATFPPMLDARTDSPDDLPLSARW